MSSRHILSLSHETLRTSGRFGLEPIKRDKLPRGILPTIQAYDRTFFLRSTIGPVSMPQGA
jgi:hypothetical protein